MRPILFAVQPLGTGKIERNLAVAKQIPVLFRAIAPHFLVGASAARFLEARGSDFPVDESLSPLLPPPTSHRPAGKQVQRAARRLAAVHGQQVLQAAKQIRAELVVVDGIYGALRPLARAGIPTVFTTDDLLDQDFSLNPLQRWFRGAMRRSAVVSSKLRFFWGEPSYLTTPEIREWARRHFHFVGPVSGLANLDRASCATLRDDWGLSTGKLLTICAGGSSFHGEVFLTMIQAATEVAAEEKDLTVAVISGPEISADHVPSHWRNDRTVDSATRIFAASDLCVIPASLSLLSECAGLGVPTLAIPVKGHAVQLRMARYYHERHGVDALPEDIDASELAARISARLKTSHQRPAGTHDAMSLEDQVASAHSVADLICEALGRRRPVVPVERMRQRH